MTQLVRLTTEKLIILTEQEEIRIFNGDEQRTNNIGNDVGQT